LFEAIQDESAKLCFIFHNVDSVLYFPGENVAHLPLENIVPEILLPIRYNKPVKVERTLKIVHNGL